jgi:hypothetical protein
MVQPPALTDPRAVLAELAENKTHIIH